MRQITFCFEVQINDSIEADINQYNIIQILISADYLQIDTLKTKCIRKITDDLKVLLREAYKLYDRCEEAVYEIPFDQIDEGLVTELVASIHGDYKAIARLI